MRHTTLDAKVSSALVLKEMYGLVSSEPIKLPEEMYLVSVR
jgi:hypothetical protein